MVRHIVAQDDGRWAVFDTVSNQLAIWDATEDELEDWLAGQAADDARKNTRGIVAHLKAGSRPRHWPTWAEALLEDRRSGGEASAGGALVRGEDPEQRVVDIGKRLDGER